MSYELSGLAPKVPRAGDQRFTASKLPYPARISRQVKHRTRPHELTATMTRLPAIYVQDSNLSGLGFSLKPPRWVRKLTLKKVLKPLAIGAAVVGAAFIPGGLPFVGKAAGLLTKGAVGAGKFVLGAGKSALGMGVKPGGGGSTWAQSMAAKVLPTLAIAKIASPLARGMMSRLTKKPDAAQGAQTQAQYDAEQAAANQAAQAAANQAAANQAAQDAANQAAANQVPYNQPTYAPGGGGTTSPYGLQTESESQASMGTSSLIPIGLGLVALVAVSGALKRTRK